jgi:hypothetical protein
VSTYRLDTAKLARDVDRARRAGADDEISYREIARQIGAGSSSTFTRLNDGYRPDADILLSLLMWLNPEARLADYTLLGDRRAAARPAPRRREFDRTPATA